MLINDLENFQEKFKVLYLDPPWQFKTWSKKGEGKSAQNHYKCMSFSDLEKLPIPKISHENSIMFMWTTCPLFPSQIQLMEKWGFEYKTIAFSWLKLNKKSQTPFIGLGYYSRSNMEHCVLGTKGKPGRPNNKGISSVIMSPIREHSRKPDEVRTNIEKMYDGPRIELFARQETPGWTSWGNEINKFNGVKPKLFRTF